jgi:Na+-translocating ferredoxin:NAD+ oxidoreductase RnfC subunit
MTLSDRVRAAGVVGAGGGGFPSHVKVAAKAEYVIANGAECEPLMHKDAELMAAHAEDLITGMSAVMEAVGATTGIIGIKAKNAEAVKALTEASEATPIGLHILGDFYPSGDEFVLVYEATGRLIPPAGIPLDVGAVVLNVESLCNIAAALQGAPVTHKWLTVTGAVPRPYSCRVPVGVTFRQLVDAAGGAQASDPAVMVGGAMMGRLTHDLDECVTKTTGGIIVLPGDHPLVARLGKSEPAMHRIGKSTCDQCSYCTELCPRYLLGYKIEPHKVMRSLLFDITGQDGWNQWGQLCCECGLCTLYACPEDLFPREACQRVKQEFLKMDPTDRPPFLGKEDPVTAHPMYESRRIPVKQLIRRLGLVDYDHPAPFQDILPSPARVRLPLKQHAGAPASACVASGAAVQAGDLVAEVPDGTLGARIHASISGTVQLLQDTVQIDAA